MEQGNGSTQAMTHSPEKQVSRGVTAIYKDYLGRGPTHAATEFTRGCAITTLTDSMTRAEHVLVEAGDAETVREMRRRFQTAMRGEITTLVEGVTGRKSAAFLSDHDTVHDVAVEVVVLAPE